MPLPPATPLQLGSVTLSNVQTASYALSSYFTDPQSSPLTFYLTANPQGNASVGADGTLSVTGSVSGLSYGVTVAASNALGLGASETLSVTESAPAWQAASGLYTNADGSYSGAQVTRDRLGASYAGSYVQVQLPAPIVPASYFLMTGQGGADYDTAKNWWLLGSDDGVSWTLLSTVTGNSAISVTTDVTPTNDAYSYFRLIIGAQQTAFPGGSPYYGPIVNQLLLNGATQGLGSISLSNDSRTFGLSNFYSDPNDSPLSYWLSENPYSNATLDPVQGTLTVAGFYRATAYNVVVGASNVYGGSNVDALVVAEATPAVPTVLSALSNLTFSNAGVPAVVPLAPSFSDPQGSPLYYWIQSSPYGGNATVDATANGPALTVRGVYIGPSNTAYTVVVGASNIYATSNQDTALVVQAATLAPAVVTPLQSATLSNPPYVVGLSNAFSDPQGVGLSYWVSSNSTGAGVALSNANGANTVLYAQGNYRGISNYNVVVSASNTWNQVTSQVLTLTEPVAVKPTLLSGAPTAFNLCNSVVPVALSNYFVDAQRSGQIWYWITQPNALSNNVGISNVGGVGTLYATGQWRQSTSATFNLTVNGSNQYGLSNFVSPMAFTQVATTPATAIQLGYVTLSNFAPASYSAPAVFSDPQNTLTTASQYAVQGSLGPTATYNTSTATLAGVAPIYGLNTAAAATVSAATPSTFNVLNCTNIACNGSLLLMPLTSSGYATVGGLAYTVATTNANLGAFGQTGLVNNLATTTLMMTVTAPAGLSTGVASPDTTWTWGLAVAGGGPSTSMTLGPGATSPAIAVAPGQVVSFYLKDGASVYINSTYKFSVSTTPAQPVSSAYTFPLINAPSAACSACNPVPVPLNSTSTAAPGFAYTSTALLTGQAGLCNVSAAPQLLSLKAPATVNTVVSTSYSTFSWAVTVNGAVATPPLVAGATSPAVVVPPGQVAQLQLYADGTNALAPLSSAQYWTAYTGSNYAVTQSLNAPVSTFQVTNAGNVPCTSAVFAPAYLQSAGFTPGGGLSFAASTGGSNPGLCNVTQVPLAVTVTAPANFTTATGGAADASPQFRLSVSASGGAQPGAASPYLDSGATSAPMVVPPGQTLQLSLTCVGAVLPGTAAQRFTVNVDSNVVSYPITLAATNAFGQVTTNTLTVTQAPTFAPTVKTAFGATNMSNDSRSLGLSNYFYDSNGSPLYYWLANDGLAYGPPGTFGGAAFGNASLSGSSPGTTLDVSSFYRGVSNYSVVVGASNVFGQWAVNTLTVNEKVSVPPAVTPFSSVTLSNQTVVYQLSNCFADPQASPLSYWVNSPSPLNNAVLDAAAGTLTVVGNWLQSTPYSYSVGISASNIYGRTSNVTVPLVEAAAIFPQAQSFGSALLSNDSRAYAMSNYWQNPDSNNPNFSSNSPLYYWISTNTMSNATLSSCNLTVPGFYRGQGYTVTVSASNVYGEVTEDPLAVTEVDSLPPTVTQQLGAPLLCNQVYNYGLSNFFSDPQGSPISYWIAQNPLSNATLVNNVLSVNASWRASSNVSYNVVVLASNIYASNLKHPTPTVASGFVSCNVLQATEVATQAVFYTGLCNVTLCNTNSSFTLSNYFWDSQNSPLSYWITSMPYSNATVTGSDLTSVASSPTNLGTAGPTYTKTGSVPVVAFSPFNKSYAEGAFAFSGSVGNYLTLPNPSPASWSTVGLTCEAWVNLAAYTAGNQHLMGSMLPTAVNDEWSIGVNPAGQLFFYYYNAAGSLQVFVTTGSAIPLNVWTHVAASTDGATVRVFVNGSLAASAPFVGTGNSGVNVITVGQYNGIPVNATIASIRVVTGAALYTAPFARPTAPLALASTGVTVALLRAPSTAVSGPKLTVVGANRGQTYGVTVFSSNIYQQITSNTLNVVDWAPQGSLSHGVVANWNVQGSLTVGANPTTPAMQAQYPMWIQSTNANNVSVYTSGDITAFSDARYKTDVEPIENALDKVSRIGGYTFRRADDERGSNAPRRAGVIAQELAEVLPEVIDVDTETGHMHVAYGNVSALLIQAIKELKTAQDALSARLSSGASSSS